MTEYIDLTCNESWEEFEFPEIDGLTNEDLANIDVDGLGGRQESSQHSESIPITGDLLEGVLRDTLSQAEIYRLERRDIKPDGGNGWSIEDIEVDREQDGRPIPVEITAQAGNNSVMFVAKKSAPPRNLIDSGKNEKSNEQGRGVEKPSINNEHESSDSHQRGSIPSQSQPAQQTRQQQQQQAGRNEEEVTNNQRLRFPPVVINQKIARKEVLSIASQITQSVVDREAGVNSGQDGSTTKNGEDGFIQHGFPSVSSDTLRGPDPAPDEISDQDDFISVRELALPENMARRTVANGIVQFVLVEFKGGRWCAASISRWEEITNALEVKIHQQHFHLRFVMQQSKRWRGCGSYGLNGMELQLLEDWRDLIPRMDGSLNTFPRDALTINGEITAMLMDDLKTFNIEYLSNSLFTRNTSLRGHIRVAFTKKYGPNDFTFMQQSKNGWRLCYLEADAMFMRSLQQHTEKDRFIVGVGSITIKGGLRKPAFLHRRHSMPWSMRKWTRDPLSPLLRTLTPIPVRSSTPISSSSRGRLINGSSQVQQKIMETKINNSVAKPAGSGAVSKPKTRSERLKIARLKKAAAKIRAAAKK